MHVPTHTLSPLQDLLARAPLPGRSSFLSGALASTPLPDPSPSPVGGLAAPQEGPILSAHAPRGGLAQGGSGSWDPAIFRPDRPVSCYCGLQFSTPEPAMKPGTGFAKEGCGKWVRTLKSGNVTRKIVHNCDVLSCPTCMPGAITQKANDIENRFDRYEEAKTAENAVLIPGEHRRVKPRHFPFTISPAHQAELVQKTIQNAGKWDPEVFLDLFREEFKEALKISGLIGGFSVYHDSRVRHPDTGLTGKEAKHLIRREAQAFGNMKDDDPDWVLYDHIRKQKNWQEYYYFAPHFHVIGFGKVIDIKEFEEKMPGWTYHNKRDVKTPGGLARYLISHMALLPDRHCCTWFGRLSSAVLGKEVLRTVELPVICEETGEPWIIIASAIPAEVGAEYVEKITEYLGFFRKKKRKKAPDIGDAWKKMDFPGASERPKSPGYVKERGILAMSRFVDEFGRL